MLKRILVGIVIAVLTGVGVVIPDKYVDQFVSMFIPAAKAENMAWVAYPYQFKCDWYCPCGPTPKVVATVEALRPSLSHSSDNRLLLSKVQQSISADGASIKTRSP